MWLTGTVTSADGAPIAGATVRAEREGAEREGAARQALTDAAGGYRLRLDAPARGSAAWEVRAERIGFFPLSAQVLLEPGGPGQVVRDFRLSARTLALPELVVEAARPAQRPPQGRTPGGNEEAWQPFAMEAYPLPPGDLAGIAAHRAGVLPLSGDEDGPRVSILGRPASQTGVLLDGASFGAATLPAEALRSSSVVSSTYDPSRGRFSGGQIAATTRSGTNVPGGAVRARLDSPWLQTPGGAAAAGGYSAAELGGGAGGALVRDRLFWYAAV
ncbi:MAG TPA: carboxypeptidase-like regulatory domain-containing protein, partial [Longimicrobium sp.]|nr:carboxypeptidase-like regulatory domain-containing protein [Longimicrobium sp.]